MPKHQMHSLLSGQRRQQHHCVGGMMASEPVKNMEIKGRWYMWQWRCQWSTAWNTFITTDPTVTIRNRWCDGRLLVRDLHMCELVLNVNESPGPCITTSSKFCDILELFYCQNKHTVASDGKCRQHNCPPDLLNVYTLREKKGLNCMKFIQI